MKRVDEKAREQGISSYSLMENAGLAVADAVQALAGSPCRVVVLAGPGNNGGDGAIAAVELDSLEYEVHVVRIVTEQKSYGDANRAFQSWHHPIEIISLNEIELSDTTSTLILSADVVVDAMFGAGLTRPLSGIVAAMVKLVNDGPAQVVAVDVPSGLSGNTHNVNGPCVEAELTVTFFLHKPAHFLYPGRQLCGSVLLAQIGLDNEQLDQHEPNCYLNEPAVFYSMMPRINTIGHKFHRGHVLVRSGPVESTGAARLSAETALRCGAGLVTVATSHDALLVNAAHLTAVMLKCCDTEHAWKEQLADPRITTVVVGPGNGISEGTRNSVISSLESEKQCVLDADALSCWSDNNWRHEFMKVMASTTASVVLTPHAGEFEHLFGNLSDEQFPSKLHKALEAASQSRAVIVYKGADTVVASPDGRSSINANAPPWLATAGTGDVLAGLIAALLAQGMPPFEASCAAVWLHGAAAESLGYPLCSEDLVGQVANELGNNISTIAKSPTLARSKIK
jgi:hydroxyethylthiazole kinase-like uncharacterized protein yjeF